MSEQGGALDHPVKSAEEGTKKAGKGIKGLLTRKVGPLPVGLWIVGIGGGLLAATWLRRSYAAGSPAEAALDGYDTPEGTGGAAVSEPGYVGSVPDDFYDVDDTPGDSETPAGGANGVRKYKDNTTWKKAAIDAATANGMSGISVQRALDRYLTGKRLNKNQRQTIDMLLATVGAPPKPVPTPPRPQNGQQAGQGHGGGGNGGGGGGNGGGKDKDNDGKGWAAATHAQAAHNPGPRRPRRQVKPTKTHGGRR